VGEPAGKPDREGGSTRLAALRFATGFTLGGLTLGAYSETGSEAGYRGPDRSVAFLSLDFRLHCLLLWRGGGSVTVHPVYDFQPRPAPHVPITNAII